MKAISLFITFTLYTYLSIAQDFTQTIRGKVLDKQSQTTLPGATIVVLATDPLKATQTDIDGKFRIENIQVGRHQIKITFLGYKDIVMPIVLSSGKELVLNLEMEESMLDMQEVVITASSAKAKTQNEMVGISSRMLTVEEANRYAGTRNDPARMAGNFAGVSGGNDTRNDIVIRGNSPTGLLWRLDGVDIPNPNHFGNNGASSGPISMLNNNTLANSDFMTGAFPAEYINAMSGVFDLKMRIGNNEKYEYTGQFGMNGIELGAEGPLSKKKNASFLINYRYSNLIIFQKMGINFGSGSTPIYQDGSYKFNFPYKKGVVSIYGLGGVNEIALLVKNKKDGDLFGSDYLDFRWKGSMYTTGINATRFVGKSSYVRATLAYSIDGYANQIDSTNRVDWKTVLYNNEKYYRYKLSTNLMYNNKINSHITWRSGIYQDKINYDYNDRHYFTGSGGHTDVLSSNGYTFFTRAYSQAMIKVNDKLTFYPGVSFLHLALNNKTGAEPRFSMSYAFSNLQKISLGYGYHQRAQDLTLYLFKTTLNDGTQIESNRNLDFTKAHHVVLGYDISLNEHLRLKAETYYQTLSSIPVTISPSSFSFVNAGADFGIPIRDSLQSTGTGSNIGLELTLERFFYKGFYFLTTLSLYDSKYKGSDGIERSTAFNGNYISNALIGKEFKIKERNFLSFDYKVVYAGGRRYTPVDEPESQLRMRTVYQWDKAYENQFPAYFRMDLKITYRLNQKRITQEWAFSAENFTNHKNLFAQEYNANTGQLMKVYQLGFFPVGLYRINF